MEDTIIGLLQTFGLPVVLIMYYLFIERPRQVAERESDATRYDKLVEKLVDGQRQCAEKMDAALSKHNEYIEKLTDKIDEIIK
jgi:hypothetical protein